MHTKNNHQTTTTPKPSYYELRIIINRQMKATAYERSWPINEDEPQQTIQNKDFTVDQHSKIHSNPPPKTYSKWLKY